MDTQEEVLISIPKQCEKLLQKIWKYDQSSILKLLCSIQKIKFITQWQKQRFNDIYIFYKKGNINIIYSTIGKRQYKRGRVKVDSKKKEYPFLCQNNYHQNNEKIVSKNMKVTANPNFEIIMLNSNQTELLIRIIRKDLKIFIMLIKEVRLG